jgi:predicted nucleic acid-binding protein
VIVVSDTSAITSLLQIWRAELLVRLFQEVVIPAAVERELRHDHPVLPDFIHVAEVSNPNVVERLVQEVDRGEAEAIALMLAKRGDILLIDERRGRRVAQREGVPVIGLLGVLTEAKRRGALDSLRETLDALQRVAGFHMSSNLKARVLAEVGE